MSAEGKPLPKPKSGEIPSTEVPTLKLGSIGVGETTNVTPLPIGTAGKIWKDKLAKAVGAASEFPTLDSDRTAAEQNASAEELLGSSGADTGDGHSYFKHRQVELGPDGEFRYAPKADFLQELAEKFSQHIVSAPTGSGEVPGETPTPPDVTPGA